ncbi:MAG: MGMT family protein [Thermaerobacterales bacterium]
MAGSQNVDGTGFMMVDTPYGPAGFAWYGDSVVEMMLPGKGGAAAASGPAPVPGWVRALARDLKRYYAGEPVDLMPWWNRLDAEALTPFCREVYQYLAALPRGETLSYGDLAAAVGRPGGARAVGQAMARNPYAPVVPCHRVLAADGSLGGYGGGLRLKEQLLRLEAAAG